MSQVIFKKKKMIFEKLKICFARADSNNRKKIFKYVSCYFLGQHSNVDAIRSLLAQ